MATFRRTRLGCLIKVVDALPNVIRTVDLVGRGPECATVDQALASAADGLPSVLLVGGDAGIGKSALVAYAEMQAHGLGYHVLEGACLDIGTSIPFGPVLEAVRPILSSIGGDSDGPTSVVAAMSSGVGDRIPISPGHALEALRQVVAAQTKSAPVLFVLEDMHWAEQSTRDFALALTRQVDGPMVVMLTFRSDDLHRRHPFRPCLLDMTRSARSQRLELEPLDREALSDLVVLRTGAPATPAMVGALLARSEGNPLYAEELLARPAGSRGLPDRLADLLLARVDALSEPSRRLLRTASVNGSRIDEEILAVVSGLTDDRFEAALREAIDRNLLVQRAGRLDFWHGLLREVLYDDLLPGERTRLHAAFGQALQQHVEASGQEATTAQAGQIAYHWYAAHELPRAFAASVVAGRLAGEYGAPEANAHLNRALELWDRVPDASAEIGMVKPDLLRIAAEAARACQDPDRSLALIDEAISLLDQDGDPLLGSRVFAARGNFCRWIGDAHGQRAAVERAVALAEDSVSEELASALAVKARHLVNQDDYLEAIAVSRRAIGIAREVGSKASEAMAQSILGMAKVFMGEHQEGLSLVRSAIQLAESSGRVADAMNYRGTQAWLLFLSGRPEDAISCSREGAAQARSAGLPGPSTYCAEQEVEVLAWMGELGRAELLLRELADDGMHQVRIKIYAPLLAAHRGDLEGAEAGYRERYEELSSNRTLAGGWDTIIPWIDSCLARGKVDPAVRATGEIVATMAGVVSPVLLAYVARAGFATLVAANESGVRVPKPLRADLEDLLRRAEAAAVPELAGTIAGAQLATARGWAQRLEGDPAPELWREAVIAWEATGYLYAVTAAKVRWVEAMLALGREDEARAIIEEVWGASQRMGAKALASDITALARRARVKLAPTERAPSGPLERLTSREREVLILLTEGASNRIIAKTLFISEKTVSVHVSNLMAKLGVSSRLEAAALAHQLETPSRPGGGG